MGKIKFVFDTNDPDDRSSIAVHEMAMGMWHTLWNFDQDLRSMIKYPEENISEKEIEFAEKLREGLHNIMAHHGVDLNRVE